jgi:type I restriction enzyme M protein
VLSNHKAPHRQGKVQLIDASELYRKLRKNLGAKNCEFAPEHIDQITRLYLDMTDDGISKVFDNADFGYYKVTVERPQRLAAQFTPERVAGLRFAPALEQPMMWIYQQWGDAVYTDLSQHRKAIEIYLEEEGIDLSAKDRNSLLNSALWQAQQALMESAEKLMDLMGQTLYMDYNRFSADVDAAVKGLGLKLKSSDISRILGAVSWRDENAAKVIKKVHTLKGKKLAQLLDELDCAEEALPDYGYWPSGIAGEYYEYEPDSNLRDTENVPLKDEIYAYFLREVRPHVDDAWIAIDKTKIGYEISFNKYFYQHTRLRSLEEVAAEILQLEAETDGLLKRLVGFAEAV